MALDIPDIGIGTWQNTDPEECASSVEAALDVGYRHVDTAQIYENEEYVGEGLARSDVDRDEIFLATKVWTDRLSHDDVLASTEESLEKLGTDHVDLLYVHWPARDYDAEETLAAFAELRDEGLIRNVGVSNFTPSQLDEAIEACPAPVAANQVEMHPYLPQDEVRRAADGHDVAVVAYSPLARARVMDDEAILEVAETHGASPAQVALAWSIAKGAKPIPKASSREHVEDNYGALELELSDDDVARIDGIEHHERLIDPEFAPDW